jgi:hypothetical protein
VVAWLLLANYHPRTLLALFKKHKRRLLALAAVCLCGLAALNAIAYRQAYTMTHFKEGAPHPPIIEQLGFGGKLRSLLFGVDLPRPRSKLPPSSLGPKCRRLTIPAANGVRLGAWFCPGPPEGPLVILFHGYNAEKSSLRAQAKAFLDMGCAALLVDFRGSGESSESYTTIGYAEADDVAAALGYARTNLLQPHSKVVLYGISMGAAAVLRAVCGRGVEPDGIIAESVFDTMLTTVKHRFELMGLPAFPGAQLLVFWGGWQAGFNGFSLNPAQYAAGVRCPILFLHGASDSRARVAEGRRVFDAVPGRKWFKEFAGVGHEAVVSRFPRQWKEAVGQFLKEM